MWAVEPSMSPSRRFRQTSNDVMDFRIADALTDSLARLTGDEQKFAKTTAFDLQLNPVSPGMQFRLDRSRDANFWSARAAGDRAASADRRHRDHVRETVPRCETTDNPIRKAAVLGLL